MKFEDLIAKLINDKKEVCLLLDSGANFVCTFDSFSDDKLFLIVNQEMSGFTTRWIKLSSICSIWY